MRFWYSIYSRRRFLYFAVGALAVLSAVTKSTPLFVMEAIIVTIVAFGILASICWSESFLAIDRWRKIGFKLVDFPKKGTLAEREALAGLAKEKLSTLAWRATALKRERTFHERSSEDAWLDKIGQAKREAAEKAFDRYHAAWDLFTKRPCDGGLAILVGPEFRDPETFRHMVSGN